MGKILNKIKRLVKNHYEKNVIIVYLGSISCQLVPEYCFYSCNFSLNLRLFGSSNSVLGPPHGRPWAPYPYAWGLQGPHGGPWGPMWVTCQKKNSRLRREFFRLLSPRGPWAPPQKTGGPGPPEKTEWAQGPKIYFSTRIILFI